MGVVESGHDEVSAQVDNLGLRPLSFVDVRRFAHRLDAIAANRNGLLRAGSN